MIRLTSLDISNFLSFGEGVRVDFPTDYSTTLLVRGQTDIDNDSNGAGKSSLFEAFYWAVTGKTVRSIPAAGVVRHGQKHCQVVVDIDADYGENGDVSGWPAGIYQIGRRWTRSTKKVWIVSPDGTEETFHDAKSGTEAALEVVGMDAELLSLVAFFGRRFLTFSRMDAAQRARVIEALADSQRWEDARKRAASGVAQLRTVTRELNGFLDGLAQDIARTQGAIERTEGEIESLAADQSDEVDKLTSTREATLRDMQSAIDAAQAMEGDLRKRMDEAQDLGELVANAESDLRQLESDKRRKDDELHRIERLIEGGHCPTCEQPTDNLPGAAGLIEELRGSIARLVDEIQEYGLDVADGRAAMSKLASDIKKASDDHIRLTRVATDAETSIARLDGEIARAEDSSQLAAARATLEAARESLDTFQRKTADSEYRRSLVANAFDDLEFWESGFRSIRFLSMERVCSALSVLATSFIQALGLEADSLSVSVWRPDGKGAQRPSIDVSVIRGEFVDSLDALSQGETQKVDLAMYFAIGILTQQVTGQAVDFRIMDEPLDGLAARGKQLAFDVIEGLPGVSQRFIIDHDANFGDRIPYEIVVEKRNGISTVN